MNKHRINGRIREVAGRAMELTGRMVGNNGLEEKGRAWQTIGRAEINRGDRQEIFRRVAEAQI
jgi:uncharacterized protein YjbJ (UPF0337 family)